MADMRDEDHALMQRIGAGDRRAYQELVSKYLMSSVRFAERMLRERADAEDVVQEACLKIWKEAPRWKPKAKFTTWFYRVIYNGCIDHQRKKTPVPHGEMERFLDESPNAEEVLIENQSAGRLKELMQRLPENQRAALNLCYYEGMSNADAAQVLDMTLGALQVTLFRARQALKEMLKD